jgi:hypothetical protein
MVMRRNGMFLDNPIILILSFFIVAIGIGSLVGLITTDDGEHHREGV